MQRGSAKPLQFQGTKIQKKQECDYHTPIFFFEKALFILIRIGNSQSRSAFRTTCGEYSSAILRSHTTTKTVLILSLSVRGLKCSFTHCFIYFLFFPFQIWAAKLHIKFGLTKFSGRHFFGCVLFEMQ